MFTQPVEAVIFDMDGLLLDTEVIYRSAIFAACRHQGREMTPDLHLSLIGTPRELGDRLLTTHFGGDFDLEAYHLSCREEFEGNCASGVPRKPGARELLQYLKERSIPIGVATSTAGPIALDRLDRAGVVDFFDVIIGRTDVTNGKPHPETYLKAARNLGAAPGRCIALEDSHNGVRAASAAGMFTIMIPDLLKPTPEIRDLCNWITPSLPDVLEAFMSVSA